MKIYNYVYICGFRNSFTYVSHNIFYHVCVNLRTSTIFFFNSKYLQIYYNHLQVSVYMKNFIFRLLSYLHKSHFIFSLENNFAQLFCHFRLRISFFLGDIFKTFSKQNSLPKFLYLLSPLISVKLALYNLSIASTLFKPKQCCCFLTYTIYRNSLNFVETHNSNHQGIRNNA